jgi:hypothetical protein
VTAQERDDDKFPRLGGQYMDAETYDEYRVIAYDNFADPRRGSSVTPVGCSLPGSEVGQALLWGKMFQRIIVADDVLLALEKGQNSLN